MLVAWRHAKPRSRAVAVGSSPAAANRACLCSFGQSIAQGEGGHVMLPRNSGFIDLGSGRWFAPFGALSLKGSMAWQGGGDGGGFRRRLDGDALGIKAQVLTTPRQLPLEEVGGMSLNGNGACRRGKPLGFPQHPGAAKMVVAVDVDEVLGSFLAALNKFIADRYSWNHSVSEYHVYEFFRIWNCSRERANFLVHEFFTTHYFQDCIHPIPVARDALQHLSSFCSLFVVTSRQGAIKNHTLEWIEKYYPGLFEQIHFGNHFALEGKSRPKSEICRSFGAQVLIDDNPRYAIECAEAGMRVLLFTTHTLGAKLELMNLIRWSPRSITGKKSRRNFFHGSYLKADICPQLLRSENVSCRLIPEETLVGCENWFIPKA